MTERATSSGDDIPDTYDTAAHLDEDTLGRLVLDVLNWVNRLPDDLLLVAVTYAPLVETPAMRAQRRTLVNVLPKLVARRMSAVRDRVTVAGRMRTLEAPAFVNTLLSTSDQAERARLRKSQPTGVAFRQSVNGALLALYARSCGLGEQAEGLAEPYQLVRRLTTAAAALTEGELAALRLLLDGPAGAEAARSPEDLVAALRAASS